MSDGVLSEETAERLRAHYAGDRAAGGRLLVALFGVFGALLVGGGVILLLAHNWEALSRPLRTLLSLLPLAACAALAAWVVARDRGAAWREAVAAAWTLAIGAAISLVGQTYHVPGDWTAFLRTWLLLALPVLHLLRSVSASLLYCLGLVAWTLGEAGEPLLFWPLLLLALPLWVAIVRREPQTTAAELLVWLVAVTVAICLLPSVEGLAEALWPPLLAGWFAACWAGSLAARPRRWERPLRIVGGLGFTAVALVLTFADAWPGGDEAIAAAGGARAAAEGTVAALVSLLAIGLAAVAWVRRTTDALPLAAGLPAVWLGWLLARAGYAGAAAAALNVYVLLLGALLLTTGVRDESLRRANAGTAIVGLLVLLRFFDSELGFLLRGVAFIGVGVAFLVVNTVLVRRRRAAA